MTHPELPALLLALFPLLQDSPEGGSGVGGEGWKVVEGVVGQAGDDVVTYGELSRFVAKRSQEVGITIGSEDERQRYLHEAVRPVLVQELEVQAGQDLGLDPERIEGAVRQTLDTRRRELGPRGYREFLDSEGTDAIAIGARQEDAIYRQAWIAKQLGYDTIGERPVHDRYIRPGELRAIYRANRADMGSAAQVRFQDLLVPVEALGGDVERARTLVDSLRKRAVDGEPFDTLVEEFGFSNPEELGVTERLEARRLIDPGLRTFALESPVGSYTEVLPIVQGGKTVAYHVVKLLEREGGTEPPDFGDKKLQEFLRKSYQNKRDNELLARERARLTEEAFLWHAPGWEPAPEPAGPEGP